MELIIDGHPVRPQPGQSLLELITQLGLRSDRFSQDPLVAKIAGEIFTLRYIPIREKDANPYRSSMRKAMAASNGVVHLLRYVDPTGKDAYVRTAQFVIFLALRQLWPGATARINHTIGPGLYVSVEGAEDFSVEKLKGRIRQLVQEDIPLERRIIPTKEAMEYFRARGQEDKAQLLSWRAHEKFGLYFYGDFADYYYGEMAPSTGYLKVWEILPADGGFIFVFPNDRDGETVADFRDMPHYNEVFREGQRWGELMGCETVSDLNQLVLSGKIRELIRVNEALHEKRYSQIADRICQQGCKVVMLAGPSSSGKTTSANRLATQLRVHGKQPILLSLDDYYIDRDKIPPGPDGKLDLEHINTIDSALFSQHVKALLQGQEVEIPTFRFQTGRREWRGHKLQLSENAVMIVEGLHALNPVLLPDGVASEQVFRLYVSPLLALNLDDHNRIPSSYLRLLRRIVRDHEQRGTSVQGTIAMWDSVRRGEKRWIFPYQENADAIFNSATLYELSVLKKHIFPLLTAIGPEEACYDAVRGIVKFLNYVREADVDDEIPPTSLVREFIGGNSFYQ